MSCNGFINILNTPIGVSKKESGDLSSISARQGLFYSLPACLRCSPLSALPRQPRLTVPGGPPPHSFPFRPLPSSLSLHISHFLSRLSSPSLILCLVTSCPLRFPQLPSHHPYLIFLFYPFLPLHKTKLNQKTLFTSVPDTPF